MTSTTPGSALNLTFEDGSSVDLGEYAAQLSVELVEINDEYAERVLRVNNRNNRAEKKTHVKKYVGDMDAGRWQSNMTPLFFGESVDGNPEPELYDGANRLRAVRTVNAMRAARGDEPFSYYTLVVHGLPKEVRGTFDIGATRNFADSALITRGVRYPRLIQAIVARLMNWEQHNYIPSGGRSRISPSVPQFAEWYSQHQALVNDASTWGGTLARPTGASSTAIGVAYYVIREASAEYHRQTGVDVAAQFFQWLASGEGLLAGNPVLTLRESLRAQVQDGRLNTDTALARIILAWNAFAKMESYTKSLLPYRRVGERSESEVQAARKRGHNMDNGNFPLPVAPVPGWSPERYLAPGVNARKQ